MLTRIFGIAAALGLTALSAHAQFPAGSVPPPTKLPIGQTFLTSDDGWLPFGEGAKVSVVPDPLRLNSVNGALRLDYVVAGGKMNAFVLPVGPGALTGARSFRVEVRADYATTFIVVLQEQGGGRYAALCSVPADKWQSVELTPSDFSLTDGPSDPKDADNKLDLDQVQFVAVTDAAFLWAQADSTPLDYLFGVKPGPHTIYLADFNISAAPLAGAGGVPARAGVLDSFSHPQVGWILLGGVQAKPFVGAPLPGRGLAASYAQTPGKLAGMARLLPKGALAGATRIALSAASAQAATLLLQVEESGGGKYDTTVYVPAGASRATAVSASFADFKEANDSKDNDGKLDLEQVTRILIFDATGIKGAVAKATDNTLYIGDLRVVP